MSMAIRVLYKLCKLNYIKSSEKVLIILFWRFRNFTTATFNPVYMYIEASVSIPFVTLSWNIHLCRFSICVFVNISYSVSYIN